MLMHPTPQPSIESWALARPCPQCGAARARPVVVQTMRDTVLIDVTLRCRICAHQWQTGPTTSTPPDERPW